jgi:hypothetical protein
MIFSENRCTLLDHAVGATPAVKKSPAEAGEVLHEERCTGDLALTALSRLLLAALSGLLALLAGLLLSAAALLSTLAALLAALLSTLAALLATLATLLLAGLLFVRIIHRYSLMLPLQSTTNPRRLSSCTAADEGAGARASFASVCR